MTKVWHIIKNEYIKHVFQKRFLLSLLSLPGLVLIMVGLGLLIGFLTIDRTPVGYIDRSGTLSNPVPLEENSSIFEPTIKFKPFENDSQAREKLDEGEIQAYYIINEDYPQVLAVDLVFFEEPALEIQDQFDQFVKQNLDAYQELDLQIKERLEDGSIITISSLDGSREIRQDQWYNIFIPFVAGLLFFVVVMTSGGYLLQAVVEEKENRTMEILVTSVTPTQLMTGKIIGNIGVGLTQLIIWLLFGWIGLLIAGQFFPAVQDISISGEFIAVLLLVLLPSFVMIAAIMAAIGATMTETKEAQQVSSLVSLPMMIPYYLSSTIMMNPNGALATALSYFPITAPITLIMRMGFTVVPAWQIAINIAILILFAILAIWFAGKAFRMGMLRYGKKLSIKEVLRKQV
ncbi:MAG: ABC transporter permease [Brevefilum sp.]|nr:ABC transporter permease [Brevefilum sp.]